MARLVMSVRFQTNLDYPDSVAFDDSCGFANQYLINEASNGFFDLVVCSLFGQTLRVQSAHASHNFAAS